MELTESSIRKFLTGMCAFMMENYEEEVVRRFYLNCPKLYLKLLHEYDDSEDDDWDD